jgi:hypothetical protein
LGTNQRLKRGPVLDFDSIMIGTATRKVRDPKVHIPFKNEYFCRNINRESYTGTEFSNFILSRKFY